MRYERFRCRGAFFCRSKVLDSDAMGANLRSRCEIRRIAFLYSLTTSIQQTIRQGFKGWLLQLLQGLLGFVNPQYASEIDKERAKSLIESGGGMPGKVQESLKAKSMNAQGLSPVTLGESDKGGFQLLPSTLREN